MEWIQGANFLWIEIKEVVKIVKSLSSVQLFATP